MTDQHTQPLNEKKSATTAPSIEATQNSPLNTPVTPTPSKGETNQVAASESSHGAEPSTEFITLHSKPAGAGSAATVSGVSGTVDEATVDSNPSGGGATATLTDFHREMQWERHGYRPVSFFNTVEEARASTYDLSKTEAYVDVRKGGFTAEELAAVPDSAKHSEYYIGFAKELLEGVFTKQFWTSFDGIGKVFSAGLISREVSEIRLEAAEWLLSKRGSIPTSDLQSPKESEAKEASATTPPQDGQVATSPASRPPSEEKAAAKDEVSQILAFDILPNEQKNELHPSSTGRASKNQEIIVEDPEPAQVRKAQQSSWQGEASRVVEVTVEDLEPARVSELPPTSTETDTVPVGQNQTAAVDVRAESAERVSKVNEKLDTAALQEVGARIQAKLEALRARIVPDVVSVRLDDPNGAQVVRQQQRYGEGFNAGFAAQTTKVQEALDAISKLGLDQPHQAGVFKRKQEHALGLVDSLSFAQGDVTKIADGIKVPRGNKLPESMKDAMANATDILQGIESDLAEARRLVASARRASPTAENKEGNESPSSDARKTGSVASMPRLGRDLTVYPRKLEMMGHAMVDANISDKDLNAWYKMVMSEFVKSYVGTFANVRKEIYAARMDGSALNELQKEKFLYLADELGAKVEVSDLVQIDYSKFSIPYTDELDSRFRRVMDGSVFQKTLNAMKSEFATALKKEIEKVPGAENTDTTYIAFKREKFEKSGVTEFLRG